MPSTSSDSEDDVVIYQVSFERMEDNDTPSIDYDDSIYNITANELNKLNHEKMLFEKKKREDNFIPEKERREKLLLMKSSICPEFSAKVTLDDSYIIEARLNITDNGNYNCSFDQLQLFNLFIYVHVLLSFTNFHISGSKLYNIIHKYVDVEEKSFNLFVPPKQLLDPNKSFFDQNITLNVNVSYTGHIPPTIREKYMHLIVKKTCYIPPPSTFYTENVSKSVFKPEEQNLTDESIEPQVKNENLKKNKKKVPRWFRPIK